MEAERGWHMMSGERQSLTRFKAACSGAWALVGNLFAARAHSRMSLRVVFDGIRANQTEEMSGGSLAKGT